jgi:hypothetical protein
MIVVERPHPAVVYRCFNDCYELLYVGSTSDGPTRWRLHAKTCRWWPEVATVETETLPSRETAFAAEALAIRDESPRYNQLLVPQTELPQRPRRRVATTS